MTAATRTEERPSLAFWVIVALVFIATLGLASLGNPLLTVLPTLGVGFFYALLKLPMRIPALTIVFLALVLESPADNGPWKSPLYSVGELFLGQIKKIVKIDALVITGVDTLLVLLLLIYAYRRMRGLMVDTQRIVATPRALVTATLAAIGIILFAWAYGIGTGGEFRWSQWQVNQMMHLPFMIFVFAALLPGPDCARSLGVLVVAAAVIKSCVALGVKQVYPMADFMTSHQDSVTFALGLCHLWIHVLENPNKKTIAALAGFGPLILMAMVVNDRRLVWVQLAYSLLFTLYASRWSWIKFRLIRAVLVAIPVGVIYLAAGWGTSGTGVFAPVGTIKSMIDSKEDASTKWRDLENFNLYVTLTTNPAVGIGLGKPFIQAVALPDVTSMYELEPYVPHNSLLGLWAYTGYVGFSTWWMTLVVAAFIAMSGYAAARAPPSDRITALTAICAMIIYMVHVYGDIGLSVTPGLFVVASFVVVAAKTAVANGGYR